MTIIEGKRLAGTLMLVWVAAACFTTPAWAVDYTWDPTSGDGQITEGSGNLDTATSNWTSDGGATNASVTGTNPFGEDLKFGGGAAGTAGTVTLTETARQFGSIETFTPNAGTYDLDLNGNSLILRRSANTIRIGEDVTISDGAGGGELRIWGSAQFRFTASKILSITGVLANQNAGILSVVIGGTLDLSGVNTFTSDITLSNQSQLVLSGAGQLGSGTYAGTITMNQGSDFTYASSADQTLSGVIDDDAPESQSNDIFMTGAGILTLTGANTFGGRTFINGGTLVAGANDVPATSGALGNGGEIDFGGGTLQYATGITQDYSSRIVNSASAITVDTNGEDVAWTTDLSSTNTGGLTKEGTGKLTIEADSDYTGVTTVNAGTLQLYNGSGTPGLSSTYQINNGTTLELVNASSFILVGGTDDFTFDNTGGGTIDLTGNILWRSPTIETTGGPKNTVSGDRFNMQNTYSSIYTVADGPDDIDLEVSVRHDRGAIVKNSTGLLALTDPTNNMSQSGNTLTINAGTVEVADSGSLNGGNYAQNITNNGTFEYNSTAAQALSGDMSGTGALVKDNASTLTLSGTNSYSGTTTVTNGTLLVNGTNSGSGAVSVANGATLGGDGSIGGTVTIASGGMLSPGN